MEAGRVKHLLDRYWSGETSLDEEQALQTYFSSGQVDPAFQEYQGLFTFYRSKKNISMVASIPTPSVTMPRTGRKVTNLRWLINVAAALLVFFAVFFGNRYQQERKQHAYVFVDTYEDPQAAYQEVKEALLFVSSKMNKGVSTAHASLSKFEPLDDIIN